MSNNERFTPFITPKISDMLVNKFSADRPSFSTPKAHQSPDLSDFEDLRTEYNKATNRIDILKAEKAQLKSTLRVLLDKRTGGSTDSSESNNSTARYMHEAASSRELIHDMEHKIQSLEGEKRELKRLLDAECSKTTVYERELEAHQEKIQEVDRISSYNSLLKREMQKISTELEEISKRVLELEAENKELQNSAQTNNGRIRNNNTQTNSSSSEPAKYLNYIMSLLEDLDPNHCARICFNERFAKDYDAIVELEQSKFSSLCLKALKYTTDLLINITANPSPSSGFPSPKKSHIDTFQSSRSRADQDSPSRRQQQSVRGVDERQEYPSRIVERSSAASNRLISEGDLYDNHHKQNSSTGYTYISVLPTLQESPRQADAKRALSQPPGDNLRQMIQKITQFNNPAGDRVDYAEPVRQPKVVPNSAFTKRGTLDSTRDDATITTSNNEDSRLVSRSVSSPKQRLTSPHQNHQVQEFRVDNDSQAYIRNGPSPQQVYQAQVQQSQLERQQVSNNSSISSYPTPTITDLSITPEQLSYGSYETAYVQPQQQQQAPPQFYAQQPVSQPHQLQQPLVQQYHPEQPKSMTPPPHIPNNDLQYGYIQPQYVQAQAQSPVLQVPQQSGQKVWNSESQEPSNRGSMTNSQVHHNYQVTPPYGSGQYYDEYENVDVQALPHQAPLYQPGPQMQVQPQIQGQHVVQGQCPMQSQHPMQGHLMQGHLMQVQYPGQVQGQHPVTVIQPGHSYNSSLEQDLSQHIPQPHRHPSTQRSSSKPQTPKSYQGQESFQTSNDQQQMNLQPVRRNLQPQLQQSPQHQILQQHQQIQQQQTPYASHDNYGQQQQVQQIQQQQPVQNQQRPSASEPNYQQHNYYPERQPGRPNGTRSVTPPPNSHEHKSSAGSGQRQYSLGGSNAESFRGDNERRPSEGQQSSASAQFAPNDQYYQSQNYPSPRGNTSYNEGNQHQYPHSQPPQHQNQHFQQQTQPQNHHHHNRSPSNKQSNKNMREIPEEEYETSHRGQDSHSGRHQHHPPRPKQQIDRETQIRDSLSNTHRETRGTQTKSGTTTNGETRENSRREHHKDKDNHFIPPLDISSLGESSRNSKGQKTYEDARNEIKNNKKKSEYVPSTNRSQEHFHDNTSPILKRDASQVSQDDYVMQSGQESKSKRSNSPLSKSVSFDEEPKTQGRKDSNNVSRTEDRHNHTVDSIQSPTGSPLRVSRFSSSNMGRRSPMNRSGLNITQDATNKSRVSFGKTLQIDPISQEVKRKDRFEIVPNDMICITESTKRRPVNTNHRAFNIISNTEAPPKFHQSPSNVSQDANRSVERESIVRP